MGGGKTTFESALKQARKIIKFKKCWKCGCSQGVVKVLEKELGKFSERDRALLVPFIEKAKSSFQPIEYDCMGCKTCFPADLANYLAKPYSCASDEIFAEQRAGFPPYPGNFKVLRFKAPVAVCTLNSKDLIGKIAATGNRVIGMVGSLTTENLGIERLIRNAIANPNLRYLILCGEDSRQRIGHLPGQSLLSLSRNGVDDGCRIIGAEGKRPELKNLDSVQIKNFMKQVELVDMTEICDVDRIVEAAERCAKVAKGPFQGDLKMENKIPSIEAAPALPLQLDPAGYFVIFPDSTSQKVIIEHYVNTGVLDQIIEGTEIGSIYTTIIRLGLISRLDHACYLGKELARAFEALRTGTVYQQDRAQDAPEEKMQCKASACY